MTTQVTADGRPLQHRTLMPMRPPRPCNAHGCSALVTGKERYCEAHRKAEYRRQNKDRPSARAQGYDHRWEKARRRFLSRPEHALCVHCGARGRTVEAKVVDHVIPHKGDMTLFWDTSNWQPLCKSCHDRKTAKEDGGFGRDVHRR